MPARSAVSFVLVAFGVTLYTTGPLYRVRTWWSFDDPLADDPWIVGTYTVVALAAIIVLATGDRWRRIPPLLGVTGAAVFAWYLLSTIWSDDPVRTARETLFVGGALLAGAAGASLLRLRALGWALWAGVHAGLVWSFVALRKGTPRTIDHRGDYAGIYFNRNSLALYAALGVLLGVLLGAAALQRFAREREAMALTGVALAFGGIGVDLWLLGGADAATPTVAAAMAAVATVLALIARRFVDRGAAARQVAAIGGVAAAAIGVVVWVTRGAWLDAIGRDSDLTGRSAIWEVALERAWQRPVHGHGYVGAWGDEAFVAEVERASGNVLSSAHNAFIEALLGGGLIGLTLFVAFVAVVYLIVATRAVGGRSLLTLWPFAVFVFVLAENMTETLIVGNQLAVALLTGTAVAATPGARTSDMGVFSPALRSGPAYYRTLEGRTLRRG